MAYMVSKTRRKFFNRNVKLKLNHIKEKILNRRYLYIVVVFIIVFILQMLTIDIVITDEKQEERNETSTPANINNDSFIIPEYDSDLSYEDTAETSININSNTACDYSLGIHRYVCCIWDCVVAYQKENIGQPLIGCWVTGSLRCEISMKKLYSNTLNSLKINHNVSSLTINGTIVQEIQDGAFNIPPLEGLLFLTLQLRGLKILHSQSFQGLKRLISFSLQEAASLVYAEKGIMYPLKNYLTQIQIQSLQQNACEIITNFTGVSTLNLAKLKIVDFSQNNLMIVKNDTFLSITSSELLYLHFSNISYIHPQAFQPTIKTVTQIFLHDNALEHLSSDLFSNQRRLKNVTLAGNHWYCDCSLSWLQSWEEIKHGVSDEPICSYPLINRGKNFSVAVFCPEFNKTSSTAKVTTITSETTKSVSVTDHYFSTTERDSYVNYSLSTTVTHSSTKASQTTDNQQTESQSPSSANTETTTKNSDNNVTTTASTSTINCRNSNDISGRNKHICTSEGYETTKSFITSVVPDSEKPTTTVTKEVSSLTTESSTDDTNITVIWCQDFVTETFKQIGIKPAKIIEVFPNNIQTFPPESQELCVVCENDRDESVEVTLKVPNNSTLIWMTHDTNDQVPHCMFGMREEVKLTLYQHDQEYIFCVLMYSLIMSPFNCVAHKTMPIYDERAWIKNKDRDIFIAVCIGIVIITLVFGIISVYAFIRRYPKLIRGKRVLVVKHRIADVLILPKQHDANILNEESVDLRDDHNLFCDVSNLTLKDGTCSSASSYVTVNEPTPIDLIAFRFEQTINKLKGLQNTKEEINVQIS